MTVNITITIHIYDMIHNTHIKSLLWWIVRFPNNGHIQLAVELRKSWKREKDERKNTRWIDCECKWNNNEWDSIAIPIPAPKRAWQTHTFTRFTSRYFFKFLLCVASSVWFGILSCWMDWILYDVVRVWKMVKLTTLSSMKENMLKICKNSNGNL